MRKLVRRAAGAGAVLTAALAGCQDRGLQEGQVPWKDTNIENLGGMTDQMSKNLQSQAAQPANTNAAADANAPSGTAPPANTNAAPPK